MTANALEHSEAPVPDRIGAGIDRARLHIAASGSRWTGRQRVELASTARRAITGVESPPSEDLPPPAVETARRIAAAAHAITAADVDAFDDPAAYVEIAGVVARTTAIDTTARGVGSLPVVLPEGSGALPDGGVATAAKRRSALVPTVGAASPPSALSLVPGEAEAQADLHGALYLGYDEMGEVSIRKGLPRWQLELVAARTSLLNDCFF